MKNTFFTFKTKAVFLIITANILWILFSIHSIFNYLIEIAGSPTAYIIDLIILAVINALLFFFLAKFIHEDQPKFVNGQLSIFDFSSIGIFQSTSDGNFLHVSPGMASIFGYASADEMAGFIKDIDFQIHLSREDRSSFTATLDIHGNIENFEARNLKKDGSIIWTSTNARAIKDAKGNVLYYEGFVVDITKQKKAENALQEAKTKYHTLIEQMPAAAYIDSESGFANFFSNQQILAISGYTAEEWNGSEDFWMNIIHPEDRQRVKEEHERTIINKENFNAEYRLIVKDGYIVWVHDMASWVVNDDGSPPYWQGILIDVSKQKFIEEQIKVSEEQYRTLVEYASDGILILQPTGRIQDANQQICSLLEYSKLEMLNLSVDDLFASKDATRWSNNELSRGRTIVIERSLLRKDSTLVLAELSFKKLPNNMLIAIIRNISNRKLMEETLARSEKKLRALIENSTDAVALYSADGKILFLSPVTSRILGYSISELLGKNALDIVKEEDKPISQNAIQKIITEPSEVVTFSVRCVCKDGSLKWIEFTGSNRLGENDIEAIIFNFRDITERKNFENALFEAEERYRLLVENLPAVIFMDNFNDRQTSQYISPRIKDLLGYTATEWIQSDDIWETLLHPDDKDRVLAEDITTNNSGGPFRIEYRLRHRNGHYVWIKEDALIIKGEDGHPLYWQGILLDITNQKNMEEKLKNRDAILKVVGFSAEQFLKTSNWDESISKVLAQLGDATDASRVYIFKKNLSQHHQVIISQAYEWHNSDSVQPSDSNLHNIDMENEGLIRWVDIFNEGKSVFGNTVEFPPEEQKLLQNQEILSVICIPIPVGSDWWGFIEFDDCKTERTWSDIEIDALRAFANTIGTSIERKANEEILLNSEMSYRGLFNSVQDAIYIQDKQGTFIDANNGAIELYGYKKEDLIGKNPEFLGAPDKNDLHNVFDAIKSAFMGAPQQLEFWGRRSNGDIFPQDIRLNKGVYFGQDVVIAVAQDITARKKDEEALQKQFKELSILHLAALAESTAKDLDKLIQQITDIISDTLYPDNCGVLLLTENRNSLIPHFSYRGIAIDHMSASLPISVGISGKAAVSRSSIRVADITQRPDYFEIDSSTRSEVCVPIISGTSLFGVLNVESKNINIFSEKDERLLNTIAGGLANALERIKLFEAEKKQRQSAETLMKAATELTNLLDLPSLHAAILNWLHEIAPYDSASILEIEGNQIRITAEKGLPSPEKALNQVFSADNILCKIINETGQALRIDDCQQDPRFEKWGDAQHVRGWMGVPLISRGQVIGYLTIDSRTPSAFTQSHAITAQTFAHQAATSLENTRLYSETRKRLEELEMVNRVSFALRTAKDTIEMLPILIGEIKASIDTDTTAIWLYDSELNELAPQAASGWITNLPKSRFKPEEGIVGKVFSSGLPYLSDELVNDPFAAPENTSFLKNSWSGLAVPIRTSLETIGVIMVAKRLAHNIESHHVRLVTTLADIAGNAIYRSNLFQKSEEQIRRLTALREIDSAITSSLDLQITLNILAEHLTTKMDASAIRVLVYNPNSQMLDSQISIGFKNQATSRRSVRIGDELASQTLLSRKELWIDITKETTILIPEYFQSEGFKCYFALPLFSKGATRGLIEIYFKEIYNPSAEWKDFARTLAGQATIAIDNAQLFENLQRSNQELSLAYDTTLEGWGKALELRDKETKGHTNRVTNLTLELSQQMGIPEAGITHIRRGTLLHDIGKMGVPDNILHKTGPLNKDELEEMRKHPQYAYDLLSPIPYLRPALDIPYCHHEWWDGSGYPRKLKGEEIPLPARIFAIIDVWDALLSDRPYRKAWPEKKVQQYIDDLSGKQFDPHIVAEFKKLLAEKSVKPAQRKRGSD